MSIKGLPIEPDEVFEDGDDFFRVEFRISKLVDRDAEDITGYDFIRGSVLQVDDGDERDKAVGTLELFLFRLDIIRQDRLDLFEVFDSAKEEAGRLYSVLFDGRTWDFKEAVEKAFFPDTYIYKVLYIHEFELDPAFRGAGLGKRVIQRTLETFTDLATIATTKPFPLQWVGKGNGMSKQKRADTEKVLGFWKSVGFQRIGKNDFFIYT